MVDVFVDLFRWAIWMLPASLLLLIDKMYNALLYLPSMLEGLINNPIADQAYDKFYLLAIALLGLLIVWTAINLILGNQKSMGLFKNLLIVGILLIAVPSLFIWSTKLTVALTNDATNIFATDETSTIAVLMANEEIIRNQEVDPSNTKCDYETLPQAEGGCDEDPFVVGSDIHNKKIFNMRYENGGIGQPPTYYYKFTNPALSFLINIVLLAILFIAGLKLYGYIVKVVFYKMLAPIFIVFKSSDQMGASFKNYFQGLYKAFLSIFLQLLVINFSVSFLFIALELNQSNNPFVFMFILFGNSIIMLDGTNAVVELFAVDVGLSGVMQSYTAMKGAQAVKAGIGSIAKNTPEAFSSVKNGVSGLAESMAGKMRDVGGKNNPQSSSTNDSNSFKEQDKLGGKKDENKQISGEGNKQISGAKSTSGENGGQMRDKPFKPEINEANKPDQKDHYSETAKSGVGRKTADFSLGNSDSNNISLNDNMDNNDLNSDLSNNSNDFNNDNINRDLSNNSNDLNNNNINSDLSNNNVFEGSNSNIANNSNDFNNDLNSDLANNKNTDNKIKVEKNHIGGRK